MMLKPHRAVVAVAIALALQAAGPAYAAPAHHAVGSSNTATPAEEALLARLKNLGDPAADAVADDLFSKGLVPRTNALLKNWTSNDQPIPAGLEPALHDFLAAGMAFPSWADPTTIARAQHFERLHAESEALAAVVATTIARERVPLEMDVIRHVIDQTHPNVFAAKAAQLLNSMYENDPTGPNGDLFVTMLKTRLMHAAVRHLILAQTPWDSAAYGTPINQISFLYTWGGFADAAYTLLPKLGVTLKDAEKADHLYLWRVYGTMLGMPLNALPTTPNDALHLAAVIDSRYAHVTQRAIDETAAGMTTVASTIAGPLTAPTLRPAVAAVFRYVMGDGPADELRMARDPFWDAAASALMPAVLTGGFGGVNGTAGPTAGYLNQAVLGMIRLFLDKGDDPGLPMATTLLG
jgi:hypothetical protein